LAVPASIGQADTSLGQEDAASYAPEAAEQLRRVGDLAREVVACELLAARQAWWLRRTSGAPGTPPTDRGTGPAPGLGPLAACLEDLVAPVDRDRPLGPDLARLVEALERDELALP
jgi:histidine ammonia-lyase